MKKGIKVIIIILSILVLAALGVLGYIIIKNKNKSDVSINNYENITEINTNNYEYEDNMKVKMKAVVAKVNKNNLLFMNIKDEDLIYVGFTDEGNIGYRQGQEIDIYYDGLILTSYPEQLSNVGKIEIIKEKSNTELPEKVLRYCYSSRDNVKIDVEKITKNGIVLKLAAGSVNNLKPSLVFAAFYHFMEKELPEFALDITRIEIYGTVTSGEKIKFVALDNFGENIV